jgi:xanthine dehydrogenase YagR molybdenum-binding subunit
VQAFVDIVSKDDRSPLHGCTIEQVAIQDGSIYLASDPTRFEKYTEVLARHHLNELTADGDSAPPESTDGKLPSFAFASGRFVPFTVQSIKARTPAGAFAAQFVEVHVDPDFGTVRVARVVTAVDGGRILNEKTARSQIIGGVVGGIGMALLEETTFDDRGHLLNASLGDYLVAVNADVPDIDVIFVGQPDSMMPTGTKGIGELALIGMAAAVANAVYHATGIRIRSLPITIEKVLGRG